MTAYANLRRRLEDGLTPLSLTIDSKTVAATPGTIVPMPAGAPHSVEATTASRMLLVMLREPKA